MISFDLEASLNIQIMVAACFYCTDPCRTIMVHDLLRDTPIFIETIVYDIALRNLFHVWNKVPSITSSYDIVYNIYLSLKSIPSKE